MAEELAAGSHGAWSMPAASGSSSSKRILFFGGAGSRDTMAHRLLKFLTDTSYVHIGSRLHDATRLDSRLLREWHKQERHHSAMSLGVVAVAGSGTAAVGQIMVGGCKGGPVPGAIALVGYDYGLVETLLALASKEARYPIVMEWPPLLFVLSAADRQVARCARACRTMRSAGIPATLEIVGADLDGKADAPGASEVADLAAELDRFFAEHLIADFPKLFG